MISRQVGMELAQGVHLLMNDRGNETGTVDAARQQTGYSPAAACKRESRQGWEDQSMECATGVSSKSIDV